MKVRRPRGPSLEALKGMAEAGGERLFPEVPVARVRAWLAGFVLTGSLMRASELAGVDRRTAYNWRADTSDQAFQKAFAAAKVLAGDLIENEIIRRAIVGVDEPVFQQGRLVGFVRRYSDKLLELAAKATMPERYRERHEFSGPGGGPIAVTSVRFGGRYLPPPQAEG
jgi:hypothetical protein